MNPYANVQMFNPGQAFNQSFQQGRQQRKEKDAQNALMQYMQAQLGDDPSAQALMPVIQSNPELGGRLLSQHQQRQQQTQQQQLEIIGRAAAMADTPEKWDQLTVELEAMGIPGAAQYKGRFSPTLRAAIMAKAGISDPKPAQDPGMIREFEIARQRGLIPQNMDFQQYLTARNPGMQAPIILPENVRMVGGGQQGGQMPRVSSPQEAAQLPPGTQFMLPDGRIGTVPGQGGPTPPASGVFPSSGN